MACLASIYAPHYDCLVLQDSIGLDHDPVAGPGAVARGVIDRDTRIQLLKSLDERAVFIGLEFGQLFVRNLVSNECRFRGEEL